MVGAGRYWAFISYSHADEAVAQWLHKALETYRLPKKLVGTVQGGVEVPARLFPVFRDRDELASADSLGAKINDALARAEALIVIASKKSATSHWVNEEIRAFKALGKGRRVYCVIADGEPFASEQGASDDECFAPALRRHVDARGQLTDARAEPIAADIRPGKDGKHDALLKLVAGILDVGLDTLKQRDLQRRQRRLTVIASAAVAASVFTTGLSIFAIQARNEAQAQRQLAQARQTQAEGLIQFVLGDLRKKLEPIGKLEILDAVGEQAMSYFGQVAPETLSDTELAARAQALRQIGDVRVRQGKLAEASPAFEEALRLDEELVRRDPDDQQAIFNVAQSEFYVGYDAWNRKDLNTAIDRMQRYHDAALKLISLSPQSLEWQQELAYAKSNLSLLDYEFGRPQQALVRAREAQVIKQSIHDADPTPESAMSVIEGQHRVASLLDELGETDASLRACDAELAVAEAAAERWPADARVEEKRAYSGLRCFGPLLAYGRLDAVDERTDRLIEQWTTLLRRDPTRFDFRVNLGYALVLRAQAQLSRMQVPAAEALLQQASQMFEALEGDAVVSQGNVPLRFEWLQTLASLALTRNQLDDARAAADQMFQVAAAAPSDSRGGEDQYLAWRIVAAELAAREQPLDQDFAALDPDRLPNRSQHPSALTPEQRVGWFMLDYLTSGPSTALPVVVEPAYVGYDWVTFQARHPALAESIRSTPDPSGSGHSISKETAP